MLVRGTFTRFQDHLTVKDSLVQAVFYIKVELAIRSTYVVIYFDRDSTMDRPPK